ncbi:hypothetical protein LQL77_29825 [Rhodococcus cerastii]|nr:hypothetical protein [Rhodococcus cerastii]
MTDTTDMVNETMIGPPSFYPVQHARVTFARRPCTVRDAATLATTLSGCRGGPHLPSIVRTFPWQGADIALPRATAGRMRARWGPTPAQHSCRGGRHGSSANTRPLTVRAVDAIARVPRGVGDAAMRR